MWRPRRLGCLSFHPRKIVTTGEGGAITTNDAELAETIRTCATTAGGTPTCPSRASTTGYPTSSARSASRSCGDSSSSSKSESDSPPPTERLRGRVELPSADEGDRHGWQAYIVRVDRRDEALATLRDAGIEAQIGTYALHRLGAYRDQGPFPGADAAYERALALPFHNRLTEEDLARVADVLTML